MIRRVSPGGIISTVAGAGGALFCRQARRRVRRSFRDLWSNDDTALNEVAGNVMQGGHEWLAKGRMDLGLTAESFRTRYITERQPEEKPRVAAAS